MIEDLAAKFATISHECAQVPKKGIALSADFIEKYTAYIKSGARIPGGFYDVIFDSNGANLQGAALTPISNYGFAIAYKLSGFYTLLREYENRFKTLYSDKTNDEKKTISRKLRDNDVSAVNDLNARITSLPADEKDLVFKFLTNYEWWHGGKEVGRTNDFVNSPLLKCANLVAAANGAIPSLAAQFAENPDLLGSFAFSIGSDLLTIKVDDIDNKSKAELVSILLAMEADTQTKSSAYRILGLKYPVSISKVGANACKQIVADAGLPDSYDVEINKGIKLHALIADRKWGLSFHDESHANSTDRLSIALKLFAKKRVVEEWCSDNTDGDANKPRAGYVVNKMRRGVPMAAPVVTQLQHGTAAQIRDWFKSANDPNSLKSVVDAVVDGDIVTFGSYLAHLIQPQVPAPARPSKFTRLLESVARNMIAPEKFGVYDENAHKALSFLGLISFGYNADFSDIDYEDALHAQRIILRRLREMKLPQVQEFGVTYNPPPDPNWKDADFLTVNEFLWFILQEDNLKDINKKVMEMSLETPDPNNKKPGNKDWKDVISDKPDDMMSRLVAALLTKPFAILAGASGTGKSRMVRKLAYMTCLNTQLQPNPATKKSIENFRMVQVKPNWHDSTDLLGYRSAVSGSDKYVSTDFVRFILKAHAFPTTPFFVCLDEMNLAPVEHYFAEFLSAMESGRVENGVYITDPVISPGEFGGDIANLDPQGYSIPNDRKALIETHGLYIPKNLFVVGTVNMDDSTRGFSRKVLDRAMTIVMDKVDFTDLQSPADLILVDEKDGAGNVIKKGLLLDEPQIKQFIERVPFEPAKFDDPFRDRLEAFRKSLANTALAFAFRFAIECTQYREAMRILYSGANPPITEYDLIALDHLTLMKLLPRLEGNKDERAKIIDALKAFFQTLGGHDLSAKELARMITAAETNGGYLSFWP